ncbi:MAG: hypothetical protein ACOYO0_14675 [Sandarakinorhabdus sp.]
MKRLPAIAALIIAAPLFAQTALAPAAAPADAAAPAPKFSVNTPIEQLLADPAAKAVLEASIPGISAHPALDSFKAMSLTEVQPYSAGAITDEIIATVKTNLAAIK